MKCALAFHFYMFRNILPTLREVMSAILEKLIWKNTEYKQIQLYIV